MRGTRRFGTAILLPGLFGRKSQRALGAAAAGFKSRLETRRNPIYSRRLRSISRSLKLKVSRLMSPLPG
jgi:hypothetical protein